MPHPPTPLALSGSAFPPAPPQSSGTPALPQSSGTQALPQSSGSLVFPWLFIPTALPWSPGPSSQSVTPLVLPAKPSPWAYVLGSLLGFPPWLILPLTPPWLLLRRLLPGPTCCLLHPASSGHPLCLLSVPHLSPLPPSFFGLFVIFMAIVNKVQVHALLMGGGGGGGCYG